MRGSRWKQEATLAGTPWRRAGMGRLVSGRSLPGQPPRTRGFTGLAAYMPCRPAGAKYGTRRTVLPGVHDDATVIRHSGGGNFRREMTMWTDGARLRQAATAWALRSGGAIPIKTSQAGWLAARNSPSWADYGRLRQTASKVNITQTRRIRRAFSIFPSTLVPGIRSGHYVTPPDAWLLNSP